MEPLPCAGNNKDHCCYVNGEPCPYLEENTVEGRHWACGLRRELGNWDAVLASDRYQKAVAPTFDPLGMNCRDWPDGTGGNFSACKLCGANK